MKTPQVPAMPGMTPLGIKPSRFYTGDGKVFASLEMAKHHANLVFRETGNVIAIEENPLLKPLATDQKTVAERKWQSRKLAPAPQKPCDVGLFSDDSKQTELKL